MTEPFEYSKAIHEREVVVPARSNERQELAASLAMFHLAKPIPIEVLKSFEAQIDWDEYYGRWGTETLVYSDFYGGNVPEHLVGKATHVWLYIEK